MALEITPLGLEIETLQEIATSIGNDQLSNVDAGLSQDDDDPLRQMNVSVAREIADCAEAIQVSYSALDVYSAEDDLLDNIGAFKGRARLLPHNPRVALSLVLLAGAVVTPGDLVADASDNSITWAALEAFTAPSNGTYVRTFEATSEDSTAVPGAVTVTPAIVGWVSATNLAASTPKQIYESDTLYRLRLINQNATEGGAGTLDSIITEVGQIAGVEMSDGRENTSLDVDANGLPGKSFEILIDDGGAASADDLEIAQVIWDNKPPGSLAFGSVSALAYDLKGRPHPIGFSRIVRVRISVVLTVNVLPGWQASQSDDIKAAIAAYGATLKAGQNVIQTKVQAAALSVPFAEEIGSMKMAIYPATPVSGASIPIPVNLRAGIAPADIALTIVQLTEEIP